MAPNSLSGDEVPFQTLADNLPHLAWVADGTGAIVWHNRRWFEYTLAPIEDSLGWAWLKLVHPEHAERVTAGWRRSCATGEPWEDTFPLRGANGAYRWFITRAVPVREVDAVTNWCGTSTDINTLIDSENAVRVAARRKDALLAWLGHELRNPLSPILTAAHLLTLLEPGDLRLKTATDTITRQTLQLSNLVDNLLDAGRISLGKLRIRKARLELMPLIWQAVESCHVDIERRRHRLEMSLPQHAVFVDADGTRIVQLMSNLLNNAAKYMHDGGAILIGIEVQAESVRICVRDQGIGIAADLLSRVFDPYVQVGAGPLHTQGLGIGLALVKAIAEAHGGTVEARSDGPNKGSEFVVCLPLARGEQAERSS
jgi:PAS domain S-box-containing protein